jgi:hypothetical protein
MMTQLLSKNLGESPEFDNERFDNGKKKDLLKVTSWALERFQEMKTARARIERQWKLNLAFYFGIQNVIFKQSANFIPGISGTLYTPPAPKWRSRPTINRVRPIVRSELAKLTAQKPTASIIPASSEDIDMYAARAGEQIWESVWRRKKLKAVQRRTLFWTLTCGSGFLKTYWDASLPDTDSDQSGDFCYVPETPFHVFVPDLRQEDLEEQPYLIHAQIRSIDQMTLKFPGVSLSRSKGREELIEDSYLNLIGANNPGDKQTVLCLEIWVKPGAVPLFPDGAMFTIIGDSIVQGGEGWPYIHGKYPFAKFDHIPSGKFYCDSSLVDLIPVQREYNRTRGQIIEAKNRMAKPQLAAPAGSVDPRKITTEPGLVIEYTPGMNPPQPIPLAPLPSYVMQELDRLLMDMSDISGQHEVSRGQTPPGVTAATAISYLQEQDDSMLTSSYESLEEGIEKTAGMTLALVSQFWDTKRMIKVVGEDGSFEVLAFQGSNLRGNSDIRIEGGSSLPTSKAAKQAFIMDLMKMGFIPPEKGLEVMEMGGITRVYDEVQTDMREAQRENLKMMRVTEEQMMQHDQLQMQNLNTGEGTEEGIESGVSEGMEMPSPEQNEMTPLQLIVPVNNWNNDRLHIEVHNKLRKGQAFDQAPEHVKALVDAHVKQHVNQLMQGQLSQVPPEITDQMEQQGMDPYTEKAAQESQFKEQEIVEGGPPNAANQTGSST